jgi:hypothetical protein
MKSAILRYSSQSRAANLEGHWVTPSMPMWTEPIAFAPAEDRTTQECDPSAELESPKHQGIGQSQPTQGGLGDEVLQQSEPAKWPPSMVKVGTPCDFRAPNQDWSGK